MAKGTRLPSLERAGEIRYNRKTHFYDEREGNKLENFIYLDNAATTKVSQKAAAAVVEAMEHQFGNPSSLHRFGLSAQLAVSTAREQVAIALGCLAEEIIFTSGGTEANNLAILGGLAANKRRGKTIITTEVEHSSVLRPLEHLEQQGYTVKRLPPLGDGSLDLEALTSAVDEDTAMVSCMLVNSETGALSDITSAVQRVKRKNKNTLFHTDAVQGLGKTSFTTRQLGVDLLTVSGHKIHGPKGAGALYVKKGVRILPLLYGGGQEQNLRSGTEAVPSIVGFGVAAADAKAGFLANREHIEELYEYFVNKRKTIPDVCSNSTPKGTLYIQNFSVIGYRSEILLHYLADKGIYVSSGSACSKGKGSHVLRAMNRTQEQIDSALRVSFCTENTTEDIDALFAALTSAQTDILRSR